MSEAHVPTSTEMQRAKVRGILQKGMELLDVKGHDYAGDDSAFINFTLTGVVLDHAVSRGLQQEDLAFVSFIATKLARLIELRGSGKTSKNEAIEDTCMDLANYAALWGGWILTKRKNVYERAAQADAKLKAGVPFILDVFEDQPEHPEVAAFREALEEAARLQIAKEYEEWAEGEEGEYPEPVVSASERHENFWGEMTKKYAPIEDEPDLDIEGAKEATGYVTMSTVKELKEAARLQAFREKDKLS